MPLPQQIRPLAIELFMLIAGIGIAIYGAPLVDGRWIFMVLGVIIISIPMARISKELSVQGPDLTGKTLKLRIDEESCMGVGSCVKLAPRVFKIDEASLKSSFISFAPLVVLDKKGASNNALFMAAQSCPYKAIILEDEVTGEQLFP